MIKWFLSLFSEETTTDIVSDIFDKIDRLEKISEQQELIFDYKQSQIDALLEEQQSAVNEGLYAEAVATKLRSLVEPVNV